jgi:FixJ family two-component response regulator
VRNSRTLVVIVDDDTSVRESLPDLLLELGFDVRTYASAGEFLDSARIAETDCILVDIQMPGMDGFDLLRELRARGYDIPAVLMTGYADDECRRRLKGSGAVAILQKPFGEGTLLHAIEAALRQHRDAP